MKNQPRRPGRVPALYALCPRCGFAARDRGASSRMTSSVYRPLCSFGFAFRGGRFSVPCEFIRSGGDDSRSALRHAARLLVLRTSHRAAPGSSRCALRNGLRPAIAPRAGILPITQRSLRYAQQVESRRPSPCRPAPPMPHIASRATSQARSACTAQRESDHTVSASEDPGSPPTGWMLCEVGGDAKRCEVRSTSRRTDTATSSRRGALRIPKSEWSSRVAMCAARADAVRCEVRSTSRRSATASPTHAVRNAWPRGSTEHEEITGQERA